MLAKGKWDSKNRVENISPRLSSVKALSRKPPQPRHGQPAIILSLARFAPGQKHVDFAFSTETNQPPLPPPPPKSTAARTRGLLPHQASEPFASMVSFLAHRQRCTKSGSFSKPSETTLSEREPTLLRKSSEQFRKGDHSGRKNNSAHLSSPLRINPRPSIQVRYGNSGCLLNAKLLLKKCVPLWGDVEGTPVEGTPRKKKGPWA